MIKALIFDCFGVFYTDPVFAYIRDPSTPPEKAEALHSLDEQAARSTLDKNEFVAQSAVLLKISQDEAAMIDDMQTTCDIVKTFGMQSICYKDFEQCKAELTALIQ